MGSPDIWIPVGIGLLTFVLAYMGVHVTLYPPEGNARVCWALAFFSIAIGCCALIAWQAIRSVYMQNDLQTQLRTIQQNTERKPAHSSVSYKGIGELIRFMNMAPVVIQAGNTPNVPIGFLNSGEYSIDASAYGVALVAVKSEDVAFAFDQERKSMQFFPGAGTLPARTASVSYYTTKGPKLTDKMVKLFVERKLYLCGFGALKWKDASGWYETDFGQCAIEEPDNKSWNWHSVEIMNREIKLK